jgi:dTDP-glucose 4,6-dehydratase
MLPAFLLERTTMRILITGCLGFIGSHFVKYTLENKPDHVITGFSRLSSQKNLLRIEDVAHDPRFSLVFGDLTGDISGLLEHVDIVVNFAAKTFVDHSIKDPQPFVYSNILGTYNLLEQARKYQPKLFIQISTDEVYGAIMEGAYQEDSRLNPTNPYSSTKAAADMLVVSYGNTYKLPWIITRTENNYGSFQHQQKVFPAFVKKAMAGDPLPVYGDGKHRRMWLRVEDHCSAIWHLIEKEAWGIYHIAGEQELENLDLAKRILKILGKPEDQIKFIDDFNIRPGHDRRYALDVSKLKALGWAPRYGLDEGIEETVRWYANNEWWLQ